MAETTHSDDFIPDDEDVNNALCVLAGSDPENCSYDQGYVKRQAVFACNTCTPTAAEPAGICLACANKCHDGHDIFELYTKRNFRCDCGNGKFGDFHCRLTAAKDEENAKNVYNHNFVGRYCSCDRPYPDADDQVNDEMIQCVVCEDWFHTRHLGCTVTEPEELQEMVCEACVDKAPFLRTYAAHLSVPSEEDREVNVTGEEESGEIEQGPSGHLQGQEAAATGGFPCKRSRHDMSEACKLRDLQAQQGPPAGRGAVFFPSTWRCQLCTCTNCKRAYVGAQVHFLLDESDSVLAYEQRGLNRPFGQHPLMAATSSMDRVQQLEVIYGYNEMMTSVTAFLTQCAAEEKVVTADAIRQLFEELHAKKRRRTNAAHQ
ncbi:putative E3 ubiquitin-protein ligase UBR7 isoform X2 [Stigmatopora argus]